MSDYVVHFTKNYGGTTTHAIRAPSGHFGRHHSAHVPYPDEEADSGRFACFFSLPIENN
jgi:hypothetical protein